MKCKIIRIFYPILIWINLITHCFYEWLGYCHIESISFTWFRLITAVQVSYLSFLSHWIQTHHDFPLAGICSFDFPPYLRDGVCSKHITLSTLRAEIDWLFWQIYLSNSWSHMDVQDAIWNKVPCLMKWSKSMFLLVVIPLNWMIRFWIFHHWRQSPSQPHILSSIFSDGSILLKYKSLIGIITFLKFSEKALLPYSLYIH